MKKKKKKQETCAKLERWRKTLQFIYRILEESGRCCTVWNSPPKTCALIHQETKKIKIKFFRWPMSVKGLDIFMEPLFYWLWVKMMPFGFWMHHSFFLWCVSHICLIVLVWTLGESTKKEPPLDWSIFSILGYLSYESYLRTLLSLRRRDEVWCFDFCLVSCLSTWF